MIVGAEADAQLCSKAMRGCVTMNSRGADGEAVADVDGGPPVMPPVVKFSPKTAMGKSCSGSSRAQDGAA